LQKYPLGGEIEAIVQASEGDVWVIARNGLFRFGESPRGALIPAERVDPAHAIRLLGSNEVEASLTSRLSVRAEKSSASYARRVALGGRTLFLNEGKDGTAWLGTKSFSRDPNILAALRDRRGYLWAGSSISGLVSTDDEGRQLETELANDLVESLFEDREGNIWVGTNNGLWRFRFGKIFAMTKRDGLSNDRVSSIEATGSSLWVGTQTGPG
jgi:ligand-binding sensor domain-containing protein